MLLHPQVESVQSGGDAESGQYIAATGNHQKPAETNFSGGFLCRLPYHVPRPDTSSAISATSAPLSMAWEGCRTSSLGPGRLCMRLTNQGVRVTLNRPVS